MSAVDDIIGQIPMADLAGRLGVDEATAEKAARQALPALLGGMRANAADPAGAASLGAAVERHPASLVEGGVDLDEVDTADGEKIVRHVFGDRTDDVTGRLEDAAPLRGAATLGAGGLGAAPLGGSGGLGGGGLVARLLPILAPIVMSYLARRMGGQDRQGGGSGPSGGGLDQILGDLLGGAGGGGGLGGLGGLLDGLLGGGRR